ncbi:uncharacterized protein LOC119642732 [Glossina fuscipes]|uniref:Uncharacterized protein LOC119642732 n=1 Tax=Glossina fuscipes TaxID=7396 RepID=A0A9C5ZN21_9MUSC|nr:uncharacterized protein LOC119642732 [Glossina fuscipes]
MYNKLRKMCGAPYSYFQRRRVKKAATMLLNEEEQMSEESRQHYEAFVSDYYTNYVNKKVKIDRRILKEISEEDPTCYLRAHVLYENCINELVKSCLCSSLPHRSISIDYLQLNWSENIRRQ